MGQPVEGSKLPDWRSLWFFQIDSDRRCHCLRRLFFESNDQVSYARENHRGFVKRQSGWKSRLLALKTNPKGDYTDLTAGANRSNASWTDGDLV